MEKEYIRAVSMNNSSRAHFINTTKIVGSSVDSLTVRSELAKHEEQLIKIETAINEFKSVETRFSMIITVIGLVLGAFALAGNNTSVILVFLLELFLSGICFLAIGAFFIMAGHEFDAKIKSIFIISIILIIISMISLFTINNNLNITLLIPVS